MRMSKGTEGWNPGYTKPTEPNLYERDFAGHVWLCKFDGEVWYSFAGFIDLAKETQEVAGHQNLPWRPVTFQWEYL